MGDEVGDFIRGAFLLSDLNEGAHDIADHLIEKSIPFKLKADPIWLRDHLEAMKSFNGVFRATSTACECREVMCPDKVGKGLLDEAEIKRCPDVSAVGVAEGVLYRGEMEVIMVNLYFRAKSSMEVLRSNGEFMDADITREDAIKGVKKGVKIEVFFSIEVGHLCKGMYSCIGAP